MPQEIPLKITGWDGKTHQVSAPTDMAMNLVEVVRSFEIAPEGNIGVCGGTTMCSCQCPILPENITLPEMQAWLMRFDGLWGSSPSCFLFSLNWMPIAWRFKKLFHTLIRRFNKPKFFSGYVL